MSQKPSLVKGTRDFSPEQMRERNFVINKIKHSFDNYNFSQIETPSMENLSTLMGKYGDEGDRLIFKILDSGDFLKDVDSSFLTEKNSSKLTSSICEKGLRYDLTVPFARYVAQNQSNINFPFRRYQIQPVWRADRPQKGRFREFYQCDADIIGSKSLWQEVELILLYDEVFTSLGVPTEIKVNNRKILAALADILGHKDKIIDITVAIDKLDKIGLEGVFNELREKNISEEAIEKLKPIIEFKGSNQQILEILKKTLKDSEIGQKGIEELVFVIENVVKLGLKSSLLSIDLTLARGLNYYTGAIFEVKAISLELGSIGGGGRYDDLTGVFGLKNISGVGISFGLDRIVIAMQELGLFKNHSQKRKILLSNFGDKEALYALKMAEKLRDANFSVMLYPEGDKKISKQLEYASKENFDFFVFVGETEIQNKIFSFKNLKTSEQKQLDLESFCKNNI